MKARPEKWSLPRPEKIHHVVEDFLTDWTAPSAHVLPLRRFLENCLQTDLRAFYSGLYKECMGNCNLVFIFGFRFIIDLPPLIRRYFLVTTSIAD